MTVMQQCQVCGADMDPSESWSFTASCSAECAASVAKLAIFQTLTESEFEELQHAAAHDRAEAALRDGQRAKGSWERERTKPDVELARRRLGSCLDVLARHDVKVRGRMAFCPFHENSRTPAMSIYADGRRAKCHACDWEGDVLDLEAGLSRVTLAQTFDRWGRP